MYSSLLSSTSALDKVNGQRHAPYFLTSGKKPASYCAEVWCAPGPVAMGAENLSHKGIRSPDRPAPSETLCRLSYSGTSYIHIR